MTTILYDYRQANRLSLEALAADFGVNKTTVMRWEAGKIPAERVAEVAKVTGISKAKLRPDLFSQSRGAA